MQDQEDSNALINTSFEHCMKKLKGFKVSFVGDLKPTHISIYYTYYTRFMGLGIRSSFDFGYNYL